MKNSTLLTLVLCALTASLRLAVRAVPTPLGGRDAIPVASLWRGGPQVTGGQEATGVAFLLPKASADFSDLDVRDAQNQPIRDATQIEVLETIFRENLLDLTVFTTPHIMTGVMDWLDAFSHLFNKLIYRRLYAAFECFEQALCPSSKRFVHNVHKLWISFSVDHSVAFLRVNCSHSSLIAFILPLRC